MAQATAKALNNLAKLGVTVSAGAFAVKECIYDGTFECKIDVGCFFNRCDS